eukprot:1156435-Pelagomonas_calceolata.AAC.1
MDIGSGDRLVQHNLQIPAHASNRIIPPYLFPRNFLQRSRLTSSRPDAILVTPYQAKPTSSTSCSHYHKLRSRHNPTQRITTAKRVKQPHKLNVKQRHVHSIEIKYCKDTRPGQQLEAPHWQHADLCRLMNAKVVTLHTIFLGVSGTCYTEHALNQFKQLGLDDQRANKLARKLHAHSV